MATMFRTWFRTLAQKRMTRAARRRPLALHYPRLMVHLLEERTVPTTVTAPGAEDVTRNGAYTFGTTVDNGISVTSNDPVTVQLGVMHGALTLSTVSNLSGDTDGSDGSLNFSGSPT